MTRAPGPTRLYEGEPSADMWNRFLTETKQWDWMILGPQVHLERFVGIFKGYTVLGYATCLSTNLLKEIGLMYTGRKATRSALPEAPSAEEIEIAFTELAAAVVFFVGQNPEKKRLLNEAAATSTEVAVMAV